MKEDVTYKVSKLARGTVLDHLRAGTALRALRVLALPADTTVTVGVNLASARMGKKDIIKIEGYELTGEEAAKVALLSPDASLAIIRDYKVVAKHDLKPPAAFRGLLKCPNAACIVHQEHVPGSFVVERREPVQVRCEYCERTLTEDEFEFA
ncbi:MAG: aspartate carbamoyltransferase regulatory subunit [Planctomycetota bacterium]